MDFTILSTGCFVGGASLISYGVYLFIARGPRASLHVAQPSIEISDAVPGHATHVSFRMENHSSRAMRFVGMAQC